MLRRTKQWFILLFLICTGLFFPAIKAEAASTTWQEDYTYELDMANHYIKLQKYNGTAETHTVPAKATIDDVEYRTYIGTNGIWVDASNLRSLSFESGIKMGSDLSRLFYDCGQLTSLDVSKIDTSSVTNMSQMFMECSGLTSLDLTGFNTSSVTDMHMMFYGCSRLNNLNIGSFNTSNVTDMSNMFQACPLIQLDLSSFNTSKVTKMSGMFYRCEYLKKLDLSHFDTSHITSTNIMFDSCLRLEELKINHFDMSEVTDMGWMFNKCQSLTSLDLSSFDMANVIDASSFLKNCNSLNTIKTPKNNPLDIDLPDSYYDDGYNFYTALPKDSSSSILLTRGTVDASAVSVEVEDQIYTGEAIEPPVTVKLGGKTIDPSNYTLTYKNNINPGTATVTVTFSGSISGTVEKTFKIKDLNEIEIEQKDQTSVIAPGESVPLTVGGTEGYDVTWGLDESSKEYATISQDGLLTLKDNSTGKSVEVIVTLTKGNITIIRKRKFFSARKQVVKSVTISGKSEMFKGGTITLVATVKGKNLKEKAVRWELISGPGKISDRKAKSCKIKATKTGTIKVRATSKKDSKKQKTFIIKVKKKTTK